MGALFTVGLTRTIAVTTTAKINGSRLNPGRYVIRIDGSPCFILQGTSSIVVTSTTGIRLRDGDAYEFDVPLHEDWAFLSIITESGTATAYVTPMNPAQIGISPPAWA